MIFKNPSILWLLSLLIIPILVHLFQWRKFKKEYFTNVAFLTQVVQQNRKSQTIKKWLLLLSRLLALAFLIIAFAQPYIPATEQNVDEKPLVLVTDQNWGMQAKIQENTLLQKAAQDILKNIPENQKFTLITSDDIYENVDKNSIRNELMSLPFTSVDFSLERLAMRMQQKKIPTHADIILFTNASANDSYQKEWKEKYPNSQVYILQPESKFNASIDSVYIQNSQDNRIELGIDLSSKGTDVKDVSLSVYDGQNPLAKQTLTLENKKSTHLISLPYAPVQGYVRIEDGSLDFDNEWYFSVQKAKKTRVLVIYDRENPVFLSKIATEDEFVYKTSTIATLDYPLIDQMDAVVVYELEKLPSTLSVTLQNFVQKGGRFVFIPNANSKIEELNTWFSQFSFSAFEKGSQQDQKVQRIVFNHPLYKGVFSGTVQNFQYPQTKQFFRLATGFSKILSYDDDTAFAGQRLMGMGTFFVFANPFAKENGNFTQSPLIVPTLYRMLKRDQSTDKISHLVGSTEQILLPKSLPHEAHIKATGEHGEFIPFMQQKGNATALQFDEFPKLPGLYHMVYQKDTLQTVGFNIPRSEAHFATNIAQTWEDFPRIQKLDSFFSDYQAERTTSNWWKMFVVLLAFMLLMEVLIQKIIK